MNLRIKKLMPEMWQDYLYYFENIAFTDHEEFSMCYCLESHLSAQEDDMLDTKEKRRKKVKELIQNGIMNGYLIYSDENIVAWSNVDRKANYAPIIYNKEYISDVDNEQTIVIYCLEIAPNYRGKGISHYIIEQICKNAKEEGYKYVESYPFVDVDFPYQYRGPLRLYEKHGFSMIQKGDDIYIMRKQL